MQALAACRMNTLRSLTMDDSWLVIVLQWVLILGGVFGFAHVFYKQVRHEVEKPGDTNKIGINGKNPR